MREVEPIAGACVWHGGEMAHSTSWQRRLSAAQLAEIDAALAGARARGLAWEEIGAAEFPLPGFAALADDIRGELEDGSGIVLLRGIEPHRYRPDDLKRLYAGRRVFVEAIVDVDRDAPAGFDGVDERAVAGADIENRRIGVPPARQVGDDVLPDPVSARIRGEARGEVAGSCVACHGQRERYPRLAASICSSSCPGERKTTSAPADGEGTARQPR